MLMGSIHKQAMPMLRQTYYVQYYETAKKEWKPFKRAVENADKDAVAEADGETEF